MDENWLQYSKERVKEKAHHRVLLCYIETIKMNLSVSGQRDFG